MSKASTCRYIFSILYLPLSSGQEKCIKQVGTYFLSFANLYRVDRQVHVDTYFLFFTYLYRVDKKNV